MTAGWVDTLVVLVCWAAVIWGANRVNWRSKQARYSFLTFFFITLVATFRNPSIAFAIDRSANLPDLGRVLEYFATTGTATFWALVCLNLAPAEMHRRRWIVALAGPTLVLIVGLWMLEIASGQVVQDYRHRTNDYSVALTIMAQVYLFVVVAGIGLPTLLLKFERESVVAIRLRLLMLAASQFLAAIMTGSVIGLYAFVLYGWLPRDYHSAAITALILLTTIAYAAALLPARVYTGLAQALNHLGQLRQLGHLRRLERGTARLLNFEPRQTPWRDVVFTPDYVLYTLVIAVLDRRKLLHEAGHPSAEALAARLDEICIQSQEYQDLVERLASLKPSSA